jgi:hypothetical protein
MGNSLNQVVATLDDVLYIEPTTNGQVNQHFKNKLPKNKRLASVKELIAYRDFFESVSGLFVEGVEFMTKQELYSVVKQEWEHTISVLRIYSQERTDQ